VDSKLTILLADDSANDIELISFALRRAEILNPIQIVDDGEEAVAYLSAKEPFEDRFKYPFPALIILDIKMPRMTGLEVLEWLKRHPECSTIPTIVLSASAEPSDVNKAYSLGVSTYFQKPGSFNDLVKMMGAIHAYWDLAVKPPLPGKC